MVFGERTKIGIYTPKKSWTLTVSPLSPLGLATCLHLSPSLALVDDQKSSGRENLDDDFDFDFEPFEDFKPALDLEDEFKGRTVLGWL